MTEEMLWWYAYCCIPLTCGHDLTVFVRHVGQAWTRKGVRAVPVQVPRAPGKVCLRSLVHRTSISTNTGITNTSTSTSTGTTSTVTFSTGTSLGSKVPVLALVRTSGCA
jgi:hypothetical protein